MSQHFDAVVIGTGQGGSPLAVRLAQSGRRTAVIERHLFGGTCVNVGCTPTKTYVASARAAHVARHAAEYGVMLEGEVRVDLARVKARKEEVIGQSRNGIEKWLRTTPDMTVFTGHGRFTGPHSIRVDGHDGQQHDLQADAVFINTGTRPAIPQIDGIERIPYLTNSTLLELTEVPAHLVIVGGELYRARIRADVPALRQPRDGARARQARAVARGRGLRLEHPESAGEGRCRVSLRRASRRASSRRALA